MDLISAAKAVEFASVSVISFVGLSGHEVRPADARDVQVVAILPGHDWLSCRAGVSFVDFRPSAGAVAFEEPDLPSLGTGPDGIHAEIGRGRIRRLVGSVEDVQDRHAGAAAVVAIMGIRIQLFGPCSVDSLVVIIIIVGQNREGREVELDRDLHVRVRQRASISEENAY